MKARTLPGFLTIPFLAISLILKTVLCFAQDTTYQERIFQDRESIECPKLHYEFVFSRKTVSCKDLWSKTLMEDCEGIISNQPSNCMSHKLFAQGLSESERQGLQKQTILMRQKSYELYIEQYRLDLIRIDLEGIVRGIRTR